MASLGIIEGVPIFVGQPLRVDSISHVRIATLLNFKSSGSFVLGSKILFEELFGEDGASSFAGEDKSDEDDFEGEEGGDDEYVSVVGGEDEVDCGGSCVDEFCVHVMDIRW